MNEKRERKREEKISSAEKLLSVKIEGKKNIRMIEMFANKLRVGKYLEC